MHQAVGAIALSGSRVVSDFARWIHDDCSDIFHSVKRMLRHLARKRSSLEEATEANNCQARTQLHLT